MNSCPPKVKVVVSQLGMWFKRKAWEQCECILGLRYFFFPLVPSVFFLEEARDEWKVFLPVAEELEQDYL